MSFQFARQEEQSKPSNHASPQRQPQFQESFNKPQLTENQCLCDDRCARCLEGQASLKAGTPSENQAEREADVQGVRFAQGTSGGTIHRNLATAPVITNETLTGMDQGKSLLPETRNRLEQHFQQPLHNIRVHDDSESQKLTSQHNAHALTYGNHVFFNQNSYQPHTSEGQKLLAHELTHTIQQQSQGKSIQCYKKSRDGYAQEQTLGEANGNYSGMSKMKLEKMNPVTFFETFSDKEKKAWYLNKLGAYQNQIDESAMKHNVPPQLIATVILNELLDINPIDMWQESLGHQSGSIGPAQINVDTAMKQGLATMPGDEAAWQSRAEAVVEMNRSSMGGDKFISRLGAGYYYPMIKRGAIASRLRIPQFAIEAVAREIKVLLESAILRPNNPWQKKAGFTLTSMNQLSSPNDIYQFVGGSTQLAKEWKLAEMIAAAYNSPDIIKAQYKASITPGEVGFIYENARIHGDNAESVAGDLYLYGLFHSFSTYKTPMPNPR